MNKKTIKIKLVRSFYGRLARHKSCVRGLGLRRPYETIEIEDSDENRGMISKVNYMVKIVED